MPDLNIYRTPKLYLEANETFLQQKEMENNLLLGNCYNAILENRNLEGCYFVNVLAENSILASSVKLSPKIIISGNDEVSIKEIFQFYKKNTSDFKGVIGNRFASDLFEKLSSIEILQTRVTFIQSLNRVKEVSLAGGSFGLAASEHFYILFDWTIQFFEAENLFPKRTSEQIQLFVKNLIEQKNLFCWINDGKLVSMAAVIRKTKDTAIIGLVYTPKEFRGRGFGKSCVHGLSTYILRNGFKESGLLVYSLNTIALTIYEQLGYKTVSELLDIDFV